jgi:ABC-type molybdate transport system permease subunit
VFDGGEQVVRNRKTGEATSSGYGDRYMNLLIVSIILTALAVSMGTITDYGFSRFKIPGEQDWLFFILSTRMLPPVVVAIPVFLMYRAVGLNDTHAGLIILYTAFNLSFAVWIMKGFIDEIPREYEEAALVDGDTRMQAFFKIVLPEALKGIAATAVFCFITAWNEYAFALMMTSKNAQTAPPYISSQVKSDRTCRTGPSSPQVPSCFWCRWPSSPSFCATICCVACRSGRSENDPREMNAKWFEPAAQWTMIAGLVFLCQPWVEVLHRYGLTVIILGLICFMVASHIPSEPEAECEEEEERI